MTLRLRLALIYGLLASVALTLALVVGFGFYERAAFRNVDGSFALLARQSAEAFSRYGILEPPSIGIPATLRLFDPGGTLLETAGNEEAPTIDPLETLENGVSAHPAWVALLPRVAQTPANFQGFGLATIASERWRSYTLTLDDDRLLQFVAPITNTDRALKLIRRNFFILGLLGVGLVFLAGYALSGTSLRPLTELASNTRDLLHSQNITLPTTLHGVQRESLESTKRVPSQDELSFLSRTINDTTTFLGEERERLDLALQAAHMGWWEWDATSNIHRWSPEFERLLGVESGRFTGGTEAFLESVHPEDRARVKTLIETPNNSRPSTFEYRVLSSSGVRWIESRAQAVLDDSGRVLRLLGIDTDITERKRSQENVRYAAEVLESVSEAIISTDLEGKIQSWNKGAEETYGYRAADVIGKSVTALLQTEFSDGTRENSRAELATTGKWRGEVVQFHKDGTPLEMSSSVRFQRDASGQNVGMVAANRDISKRKRAERELSKSEARFRAVQQTSPDGFMMFESLRDDTGTIQDFRWLLVNPAAERIVGRKQQELLGKQLLDEMPGNREEGLFEAYVRVVETGEPWQREFSYGHEGLDKWFRSTAVKTEDGFAVSFADITESKTLLADLRSSETFNRTVLESSPDCVKVLDVEGNIIFTNENGLCLLEFSSFNEVRGCPWWQLWPREQREELRGLVQRALKGETLQYRGFAPTAKGTPKWWDVVVTPVKSDTGEVTQVLAVSRDITESQKLEQQLRQNEERFRSLVQASSQLVWSTGADGFNTEPQNSWLSFTGQSWEEEQEWGWLNAIHEADRERVRASWTRAIETKTMYLERERLRRHDHVYRHMDVRAVPVFAKDGSVREWVGTHTDVSERVNAAEALAESEERYRTLVMASNQAVFTADKTGQHSTGAEAVWSSLSGQSPLAAKQRKDAWLDAIHLDDRARIETTWREALRERKGYEFDYKTTGKGNKRKHISVRAVPRFSAKGDFLEWIGAITDITERRQLELDNEFLASVSELLRSASDAETLLPTMSKTICRYLQLPDCFFVEIDEPHERYKVHAGYFSNTPFEAREEPLSLYNPVTLREGKAGHVTVVSNTATDKRFENWYEERFKPMKLEAFVNVPFLRQGELVGSFTVASDEPYDWTERELLLIQTVTERTWLTLEKLRVDKELAKQARTLRKQADLLSLANEAVIIRTPQSVVLSWNEAATELYGYTDEETVGRNSHDFLQTRFIRSTRESVWQTLLSEEFWQGELEHTTKGGEKLVVLSRQALRRDDEGRPLEIIEINWDITSRKQVEIQREKLLELTQRSEREALALAEIASSFSLAKPFETNLTLIAQRVAQTVGADACAVEIYEDDKKELGLTGSFGYPAGFAEALVEIRKNGIETLAQQAVRQGEVIIAKEFVTTTLANRDYAPLHDLMRAQAWGTVVAVPLPVTRYAGGAVVVFYPHGLDPDLTDLLQLSTIVSQIALVVENARLFEDAQGKAALEERQRLARDLHDSVSQALYGISLGANSAKTALSLDSSEAKLKELERSLEYLIYMGDTAMAEMKSLIFELRPESLATEGLVVALRKHLRALELRHRFALQLDLPAEPDVSLEVKEMLYRITQEAMNNVVKHAQAKHVWIKLEVDEERLELTVRDDGNGFDTNREFPGHLGLRSMRERAEKLGATYELSSRPNEGTTVRVVLLLAE